MSTAYHAKYLAHELTKRCPPDSVEKLAGALVDAQVDLNPHQVDAALFAFESPLSKGALLADEVGLGKTIEAGLVLSQKWAERKRRMLVITPSNLRKQWYQELTEKFFLPCRILETKSYNASVRAGNLRPFEAAEIIICSYQFAKGKAESILNIAWDLVVIDEAHRLRNVYKPSNVIANTLKLALHNAPKLLLTATPLQNSLLELYGLVSFIDEHVFGDLKSFREQFSNLAQDQVFRALKARLKPVCHRTLRRQVLPYVRYTRRHPMVQPFTPEESEDQLYDLVSDYLRRDNLQALPPSQRSLMTLVLRKLLASSTYAIAGALETIGKRLRDKIRDQPPAQPLEDELDEDYEALDETAEEWPEDSEAEPLSAEDRAAIQQEVNDLDGFTQLALSIEQNAKGKALLVALDRAFAEAHRLGAARKAIIFTESRRTQSYLLRVLADSQFRDGIVLFNGSNNDERSKQIYADWVSRHAGTDRVSGSRSADMRSALVDYFRDEGQILIATEAGAEGINLQFCSLVVNYDLPWNPQRVEQRIGRSHRYGQQHDVVVVNFLNQKNEADQRVFQLLSEKFKLFEGVFGASDEVLGAIESGVDFEKRIADIYQRCRRPEEIGVAFDQLQLELSLEINEAMTKTRQQLLENFDDEVREKLKVRDEASRAYLNRFERLLMQLTRQELGTHAEFLNDSSFRLHSCPFEGDIPLGLYELPRRTGEAHLFRLQHPLAEALIAQAKDRSLPVAELHFHYEEHEGKVTVLEPLRGHSGWLSLSLFTVESLDQAEDHLIFAATTDGGETLEQDTATRLLTLPGKDAPMTSGEPVPPALESLTGHLAHGLNNYFVLAPNLTIYNKLIADFTPNTPKYVFKGIAEFATDAPEIITGDNYEGKAGTLFDQVLRCKVNIFNISKINSEVRGGKSPKIKRMAEYIGESYFEYLAGLSDLVLLMDESHRYRASSGVRAINELKPVIGLELTATPFVEGPRGPVPFKNIIFDYALGKAMADGFVKEPAVVTRKNFNPAGMSPEEIERLKLEDGVRLHEQVKVQLETYARETEQQIVKPFVLVIARDITHAAQLLTLIQSDTFFEGRYKERVIQVDSSKTGTEEDEMVERLLKVEHADEPTEIVIHVNMLKEGWDVTNLYTIVPLRAANARILIEQSIGRGLRLPYGKRTGVAAVDRLNIVAHDRFQEIVEDAKKSDSPIRLQTLVLDPEQITQKTVTIVSQTQLATKLGIQPAQTTSSTQMAATTATPVFTQPEDQKVAQITYEVIRKLENQPKTLPSLTLLSMPAMQTAIVQEVTAQYRPSQLEMEAVTKPPDIAAIVAKTSALVTQQTIDIPRILVVPRGESKSGFKPFTLNLKSLHYQPIADELWAQYLRTNEHEVLTLGRGGIEESRLEDYVVSGLVDFDDISYDAHADLLYELAGQTVSHFRTYLSEDDTRKVLRCYQRDIAKFIHTQMQTHYWEEAEGFEVKISKGFTDLKPSAYSAAAGEPPLDFRVSPPDKSNMAKYLFGGFAKCLYAVQKFQSDSERKLAVILEREATKWFKPAKGQFQIYYKSGADHLEYQPDFVAETAKVIYMLEPKARNELTDPDVLAKKAVAEQWCEHASNYAKTYSGKPWKYALIPHDIIADNMTVAGLVAHAAGK